MVSRELPVALAGLVKRLDNFPVSTSPSDEEEPSWKPWSDSVLPAVFVKAQRQLEKGETLQFSDLIQVTGNSEYSLFLVQSILYFRGNFFLCKTKSIDPWTSVKTVIDYLAPTVYCKQSRVWTTCLWTLPLIPPSCGLEQFTASP